jgi:hypothetical protein
MRIPGGNSAVERTRGEAVVGIAEDRLEEEMRLAEVDIVAC